MKRLTPLVLVLLFLAAGWTRLELARTDARDAGSEPAASGWVALVPSSLRVWVLNALWLRAEADLEKGRFERLRTDYRWIADLQADDEVAISYLAAQLAGTVSRHTGDPAEEKEWIEEAILLLETGLRRHPASSMLLAQLGEIYLDLLTRDPRLEAAFRDSDGRPPILAALDYFSQADDLDETSGRWKPKIVLSLFLAAPDRLFAGEYEAARALMTRARDVLRDSRETDPALFSDASSGRLWLGRAEAWIGVTEGLIRYDAAVRSGRTLRATEEKESVLNLLDRLRDRYPDDTDAPRLQERIRSW